MVGQESPQLQHLKKLKYLTAVLRESLRLFPTAPTMTKMANPTLAHENITLGGGKYRLEPDDTVTVLFGNSQKDVSVYGEDAVDFKPERMLDESFDKLPRGAWTV